MPLLNYTTSIEAAKTVAEIQAILQYHGAKAITIEYDDGGQVSALTFDVKTPQGLASVRLPVNVEAILRVMMKQTNMGKIPRRFVTRQQAVRVAWRILKDWVEAQMAILETEMVKMEQIFLPYIITDKGQTLFEVFEGRKMLTDGKATGDEPHA